MINIEKAIESLERCQVCETSIISSEEGRKAYLECEYTTGLYCRRDALTRDVIKLLKEHMPLQCEKCDYYRKDGWCSENNRKVNATDYCSFGSWDNKE